MLVVPLLIGLFAGVRSFMNSPESRITPPVLTIEHGFDGEMSALIEGRLTWTSGCVRVRGRVAFFPTGTTWSSTDRSIHTADGQTFLLGDRISGDGGTMSLEAVEALLGAAAVAAAQDCGADAESVVVFNPQQELAKLP